MHRTWAIIERELRRFRRSPVLIIMSLIFPLVQLIVLGYAFGPIIVDTKLSSAPSLAVIAVALTINAIGYAPFAWATRGAIYMRMGDNEASDADELRALELEPGHGVAVQALEVE